VIDSFPPRRKEIEGSLLLVRSISPRGVHPGPATRFSRLAFGETKNNNPGRFEGAAGINGEPKKKKLISDGRGNFGGDWLSDVSGLGLPNMGIGTVGGPNYLRGG